tara:strand:+ start:4214 stop:4540 length:327 start_codon:yes stop_codon:yes gene_type:complete
MAKLLETRLPVATDTVTALTYNKLVRILELNLGSINIDSTPHYNDQDLGILNFDEGDIIWNTSIGVLQVYLGNEFLNLHTPSVPKGFSMDGAVGTLSVKTNGDIIINI